MPNYETSAFRTFYFDCIFVCSLRPTAISQLRSIGACFLTLCNLRASRRYYVGKAKRH